MVQHLNVFFSFLAWKNTTNKSQITILDNCVFQTKVNNLLKYVGDIDKILVIFISKIKED